MSLIKNRLDRLRKERKERNEWNFYNCLYSFKPNSIAVALYAGGGSMRDKNKVTLIWKGNKIPCEDCKVMFTNRHGKEYNIELSRLIRVFNNNIWQHTKSVK